MDAFDEFRREELKIRMRKSGVHICISFIFEEWLAYSAVSLADFVFFSCMFCTAAFITTDCELRRSGLARGSPTTVLEAFTSAFVR